jgi:hypothetical protein
VKDSLLVSLAKATVAAIDAERTSGSGFEVDDFLIDWEYGGRAEESLVEGTVYVRVVVPPSYVFAELFNRGGSWQYGATLAIEIRSKLGVKYQDPADATVELYRLSQLARLVEELHEFFPSKLTERRLTLTDHDKVAEWVDDRGELKSTIATVGAVARLHHNRTFLGVLMESFEITPDTST